MHKQKWQSTFFFFNTIFSFLRGFSTPDFMFNLYATNKMHFRAVPFNVSLAMYTKQTNCWLHFIQWPIIICNLFSHLEA